MDETRSIDEFIPKYPANIYKVYLEYNKAENMTWKLSLLFDIYGQVIRFFGCVFLSEYLYSSEKINENKQGRLNTAIASLARPSLGSWFGFVCEYAKVDGFIKGFHDIFAKIYKKRNFEKKYCGRFRNSDMNQGNAFDEILALRNAIAHGALAPSEEEALELVNVYSQYIETILDGFSKVFERYVVVKLEELEDDFDTVTAYFNFINYDVIENERHPIKYGSEEAEGLLQEGKMYLYCSDDNRLLRLTEYLIDLVDEKEHEEYYLFDGFGNKKVTYLGMKYKKQIENYLDVIRSKFLEKGGSLKWTKKAFEIESFIGYLRELAEMSVEIHKKTGKYNAAVYVERECDHLLEEFLSSDKTTMVVIAEAGVGKTNFLCHSAEELIRAGRAVYFFNGGTLIDTEKQNILFSRLQSECFDEKDFHNMREVLKFYHDKNTNCTQLVLMIDAANEAYDMVNVLREVDELTSEGESFPYLKIMVSIRKVSYEIYKNMITDKYGKKMPFFTVKERYFAIKREGEQNYSIEIKEWNILQVLEAFEKYKIDRNIPEEKLVFHELRREIQEVLRNPLNMGLYFMAINHVSGEKINTEQDIFSAMETFWYENDAVTNSMRLLQYRIVEEMKKHKQSKLDSDIVRELDEKTVMCGCSDIRILLLSPLERLMDAGILFEREEKGYRVTAFVYQKYLEYLFLKRINEAGIGLKMVIEIMLDAWEWDGLPEIYIACLDFLKKQEDIVGTSEMLIQSLVKRNQSLKVLENTLKELWKIAAIHGNAENLAQHICKWKLRDIGILLVRSLYESEESDATIALIDALLKDQLLEEDCELLYLRGMQCMKISKLEVAHNCFEKCIKKDCGKISMAAKVQLAKNYRKAGDVNMALQILKEYLKDNNEKKAYYADALIQRGLCKYSEKDLSGALKDYEKALKISENNNDYYMTLYNKLGISTVQAELGNLDKCEELLLEVYNQAGQYGYINLLSDSLNGLSHNFVRKGQYERAISYAKQGLVIWNNSHYYVGQMVMFCTIINALLGLGGRQEEILLYRNKAEEILPLIREKVILEMYENTIHKCKQEIL